MKHRLKPRIVDALRWDGTRASWDAIAAALKIKDEEVEAEAGDWIIRSGGNIIALNATEFADLFEPIEPPEPVKGSPRAPGHAGRPA